jgi:hypothetical protein
MRIAIRETSRPIPENMAMATSGWLSDFSDAMVDAGIDTEMRAAFGISSSPKSIGQNPGPWRCLTDYDEGSMTGRVSEKYVYRAMEPIGTTAELDRTDPVSFAKIRALSYLYAR